MLISHASNVIAKIHQDRFKKYVNQELPNVQDGLRKGRGTRDQIASMCWIMEKARDEGSLTQKEPSAPEEETETYQQLFQLLLPSLPTPWNGPGYSLINLPESAHKHRAWPAPSPLLQKSKISARKVIPIRKKKKKGKEKNPKVKTVTVSRR